MKSTISYPDSLEPIIQQHIEMGLAENRSDWFQQAARQYLMLQQMSANALGAEAHADVNEDDLELGLEMASDQEIPSEL